MQIEAAQIRAARAMLDWSRDELALASGLSRNTIRNLEKGAISPRGMTLDAIRRTFEESGLVFTEDEGVRKERSDVKIIRGPDSCDHFYDLLLCSVKKRQSELLALFKTQEMLMEAIGMTGEAHT